MYRHKTYAKTAPNLKLSWGNKLSEKEQDFVESADKHLPFYYWMRLLQRLPPKHQISMLSMNKISVKFVIVRWGTENALRDNDERCDCLDSAFTNSSELRYFSSSVVKMAATMVLKTVSLRFSIVSRCRPVCSYAFQETLAITRI